MPENIITYEQFINKKKQILIKKAEYLLKQIVNECYYKKIIPTKEIIINRFRTSGIEQELISTGIWDKSMKEE